jgi:hypothetical protein
MKKQIQLKKCLVLSATCLLANNCFAFAYEESKAAKPAPDSRQINMEKAQRFLKSGKPQLATPLILSTLDSATDVPSCLELAGGTDAYAFPMLEVRRACVEKAFSLAKTEQDLMLVALKARQYQFYEITRRCYDSLIKQANDPQALYQLAAKAHELALPDVSHMALEKIYAGVQSDKEAFKFAQAAKDFGMTDLTNKCLKKIADRVDDPIALVFLLQNLEPIEVPDMNRYVLKKALDNATTIDQYKAIATAAQRVQETDIHNVASYRAHKLEVIDQIHHDQAQYNEQLQQWRDEEARKQAEAEAAKEAAMQAHQQVEPEAPPVSPAPTGVTSPPGTNAQPAAPSQPAAAPPPAEPEGSGF